ncbi:MAG: hypothetical protein IKT32_02430 [Clostridia bacterium]|nr:hypothetical protein [Clostridia bacterium]
MDFITIPIITAVVYAVIEMLKIAFNDSPLYKRLIPLLACLMGVICGLVAFFFIPEIMITTNVFIAIVMGGASGLAATGLYENIKNLFIKGNNENGSVSNYNY